MRTSVLGFGCGSVLGRVGRSASLRAMNAAWDEGITLFDTARSYGFGEAEAVLGEFLGDKRQQAIVATKYGIAPQKQSTLKRMILPAARAAMQLKVPGIRKLVRQGGPREAVFGQFSVEGLRASLETSLKQLRTDYVDILFLHEASIDAIYQQDLMAELDALKQAGKVLRVGLYANADVIAQGLANGPATLSAMQFGANPFDPAVAGFAERNHPGVLLIGNHPFRSEARVAMVAATLAAIATDKSVPEELCDKLRGADWQVLLEAILGVVLRGMGAHALVFSMMQPAHLRANVHAVESCRFTALELALMRKRLLNSQALSPSM
jgi:diketogulonate reductase-like aldo/keto reductase